MPLRRVEGGCTYNRCDILKLKLKLKHVHIHGGPTVIFMSGLGRPFRAEGWASEWHWLRRAWTIQETLPASRCVIADLQGGANYQLDELNGSPCPASLARKKFQRKKTGDINKRGGGCWPWDCKVCNILSLSLIARPEVLGYTVRYYFTNSKQ